MDYDIFQIVRDAPEICGSIAGAGMIVGGLVGYVIGTRRREARKQAHEREIIELDRIEEAAKAKRDRQIQDLTLQIGPILNEYLNTLRQPPSSTEAMANNGYEDKRTELRVKLCQGHPPIL